MILTGDVIDNIFMIGGGGEYWCVEGKDFPEIFFVDNKEGLNLFPVVHDEFVA